MDKKTYSFSAHSLLIVVDVTHDFLEGGALGPVGSHAIIPIINELVSAVRESGGTVVFTRDWHSENNQEHFAKWGRHSVQNTWGSAFPESLYIKSTDIILNKGMDDHLDCYDPFQDGKDVESGKTLLEIIDENNISEVFGCGLVLEYCVSSTLLKLKELRPNLKSSIIMDATFALNTDAAMLEQTHQQLDKMRISSCKSPELLKNE